MREDSEFDEEVSRGEDEKPPLRPFHHARTSLQILLHAELFDLLLRKAIEIEMKEGDPPLMILLDENEGGAREGAGNSQSRGDPLRKAGLSGPQLPDEQHEIPLLQKPP